MLSAPFCASRAAASASIAAIRIACAPVATAVASARSRDSMLRGGAPGRGLACGELRRLADAGDQLAHFVAAASAAVLTSWRGASAVTAKRSHLVGDDGEAAAVVARARGLDGGVEREQVGLFGDLRRPRR